MAPLRVALAQINPTVGDIAGNARLINEYTAMARSEEASIVVFPELALTGYPPEDLLLKTHFLDAVGDALQDIAAQTQGIVALVGFPERADDVYNAAALLADGQVSAVYRKMYLPNYGVFDEQRYFQNGQRPAVFGLDGETVGVTVCDDIWEPGPPGTTEALAGAQLIVNLSASPYHSGKGKTRERMLAQRARDNLAAVAFCNSVGGQDELVFDGHSLLLDWDGSVVARAPQFEESLTIGIIDPAAAAGGRLRDPRHRTNVRRRRRRADAGIPQFEVERLADLTVEAPAPEEVTTGPVDDPLELEAEIYAALELGVRDYVDKNDFSSVVIALSGGIDSALVALVAADALGAGRVNCVSMPSPYSSEGTRADARAIAENLGTEFMELEIEPAMKAYDELLAGPFEGHENDLTEENVQARIRGNMVMALSNKFGSLGAHHRQQVRAVGGLLDALRGHGGWVRGAQGRLQGLGVPVRALAQRAKRRRARARVGAGAPAVGRAARGAAGRGLTAPLRGAGRDPRGLHRGRPGRGRAGPPRAARGGRGAGGPHGRRRGVQAPPGPARHPHLHPRVRTRSQAADHQSLRVARGAPRALAAAAGPLAQAGAGRTAIVTRVVAHRRPSPSVKSTSQTQVVRPRCRRRAVASTRPSDTGRRKLVALDCPIATDSGLTAANVATEHRLSARAA